MPPDKRRLAANPLSLRNMVDEAINDAPENALIPQADGVYVYKRFTMTPVGLIVPEDASDEELLEVEQVLETLETSIQWNIGDWYNRAKKQSLWGRMYETRLPSDVDYKYQTLADYAWVADKIDFSIRNRKLSFSHHRLIAPFIPELQVLWLHYAATRSTKLKLSALKEDIKRLSTLPVEGQVEWLEAMIPMPDARFIHCDQLKPYTPSRDVRDAQKMITKNASFIANTWENAEMLTASTRETAIEIAQTQLQMVTEYLRRLGA